MEGLPNVGEAFGEYDITGMLGRGGMGVVYTANRRRLSRTEALKVLSPSWVEEADYRDRFLHEAEILATLDSPHIIHIYDYGDVEGTPYISTQLIRGGDLSDYIRDNGPLTVPLALEIAAQVASGLEDAHSSDIIHRDVKPSNVLLRQETEPFVYLCDFGIARSESAGLTTTGTIVGTWAYLAPERCNGGEASIASDIYSVGCLLWAMLTGEAPYRGTDVAVAMAHLHEPIPQLEGSDDSSQRLNHLLVRCMAKQPAHRFATAGELRSALTQLGAEQAQPTAPRPTVAPGSGDDTQIRRPTPPLPPRPPHRRRAAVLVVIVVAAVVLAGAVTVGAALLRHGSKDDTSTAGPSKALQRSRQTAKQLTKLARVSYDGSVRSQVAIQSYVDNAVGSVRRFGLGATGSMVSVNLRSLPPESPTIHRMNGDFDGDGRADAAFFEQGADGETVRVARSTGADLAPATTWGHLLHLASGDFSTVTGDFDGDGHMDIALVVSPEGTDHITIQILLSTGTRFKEAEAWSQQLDLLPAEVKFEPGDFNADGRTDLLVVQTNANAFGRVLVMRSTGRKLQPPATWAEDVLRSNVAQNYKPLAGDFDGDGTTDLLVLQATSVHTSAGVDATFLRSHRNGFEEGTGWWTYPDWALDDIWASVGDFDADGRADVAAIVRGDAGSVVVRLLMSGGSYLGLDAAQGSWDHDHSKIRTLNVIG